MLILQTHQQLIRGLFYISPHWILQNFELTQNAGLYVELTILWFNAMHAVGSIVEKLVLLLPS